MTRMILAALAATVAVSVLTGTGCQSTGVGDPCTPEQEYDPSFLGFAATEVSVESKSFQCQTRLCLVNHFQGRVSCPYGQDVTGKPLAGTSACTTASPRPDGTCAPQASQAWGCCAPGTNAPISGEDPTCAVVSACSTTTTAETACGARVLPQCSSRTADSAVYCSCRCADVNGKTTDGANYCTCPDGFSCTQLVSSIGATDSGLTGAYCIKNGTQYEAGSLCPAIAAGTTCNPATGNCGSAQGVKGQ